MPKLPKPKSFSAAINRSAFSRLGRMKKSMSPEYLGKPCQETASAPTIKKSTLFERKYPINSLESFVSAIRETPLLDR
jgi:putative addiction module component (TIGR02574 family)